MLNNDDLRDQLVLFFARVARLKDVVNRNATREQLQARLDQIDAQALAIGELISREDQRFGDVVRTALADPAQTIRRYEQTASESGPARHN